MSNLVFIVAGYGVILGGLAVYAVALRRRLSSAREESLRIRRDAGSGVDAPGDRRS